MSLITVDGSCMDNTVEPRTFKGGDANASWAPDGTGGLTSGIVRAPVARLSGEHPQVWLNLHVLARHVVPEQQSGHGV